MTLARTIHATPERDLSGAVHEDGRVTLMLLNQRTGALDALSLTADEVKAVIAWLR
jgi:hypothetical protein